MAIMSLLARLNLDKTGFDAALASAGKSVSKFGTGLKNQLAAAFSAAAFVAFTKSVIDAGSEVKDMSQRLGLTTDEVQKFSIAAKLGGTDIDTFATGIERMRKAAAEGKHGLESFGISREQMLSGDSQKIMQLLADDIERLGLNAQRTKELFDVFGRGAGKLVPALLELKSASKGTLFFSSKEVEDLDKVGDFFTKLSNSAKVLGARALTGRFSMIWWLRKGFGGEEEVKPKAPKVEEPDTAAENAARELAAKGHMAIQDRILAMEKEAAEISEKTRISKLTDEQRLQELLKERKAKFGFVEKFGFPDVPWEDPEKVAGERLEFAKLNADIQQIEGRRKLGENIRQSGGAPGIFLGALRGGSGGGPARTNDLLSNIQRLLQSRGIVIRRTK